LEDEMEKKHILIIGDVDSVKEYMDFFSNQYSIITSEYEYNLIPSSIKYAANAVYQIKTPNHFDATCFEKNIGQIIKDVSSIIERFGKIDGVVATHEHTVLPAAIIRSHYDIKGVKEEEARSLRDKSIMKSKIHEHGIATPHFVHLDQDIYKENIEDFIGRFNKIVIKPVDQGGSDGILITNNIKNAINHTAKLLKDSNKVLLEEYVDYPIMHIDGIAYNGEVSFLSVSRYIGTCYDFVNNRKSLGLLIINNQLVYQKAKEYVEGCLSALNIGTLVFHLEVFSKDLESYLFLEMAGRYLGAGGSKLLKEVFNFDIVQASYYLDCNTPHQTKSKSCNEITPTAMLLVPAPVRRSILIRGISGMNNLPRNITGSDITGPGTTAEYSSIDAFKPIARFFISDENIFEIEKTIHQIESEIKFNYEEV
jgi:hypothetical protein